MYEEQEITEPVRLCDDRGRLNPEAVGWSRHPLHTCNLRGCWPRKKKWYYWNITGPACSLALTVAHVDYLSFASVCLVEYETGKRFMDVLPAPLFGGSVVYPETVYGDLVVEKGNTRIALFHTRERVHMEMEWRKRHHRSPVKGSFHISIPQDHETLNVVVPWSRERFQFTSKQHCLPTQGSLRTEEEEYRFDASDSFACLDYGRGVWPYRTAWNWASCSMREQGNTLGLNFGGKWTDGTGMTENSLVFNGRLFKLSEDVEFRYDRLDFLKPWTLRTRETRGVDLEFRPFYNLRSSLNLGLLRTRVNQVFGRYFGRVEPGDSAMELNGAVGWAEEHLARW